MKCTIYWTLIYGIILDSEGTDMLNFIIGTAGSGKSYTLQHKLIDESLKNPESRFVLLVPDQYSLEAQKEILDKHPNHGAFNIEVSSFNRLAYEVLDEQGFNDAQLMTDLAKTILVRKCLIDCKDELEVFKGKVNMPGFTDKMKSIINELGQYNISQEKLAEIIEKSDDLLGAKLQDVFKVRERFISYVTDNNLTTDELLDRFIKCIPNSDIVENTYIYLDGFTGFTPIQERVIEELTRKAKDVTVTATMPKDEFKKKADLRSDELFFLGKNTVKHLRKFAAENGLEGDIKIIDDKDGNPRRIQDNDALSFVSRTIFGQSADKYDKEQDSIEIHEAESLENEVLTVVKRIERLVRNEGYRYRDFAIITADLESYYPYLDKITRKYEIPVFIDYKRRTGMNAFADLVVALARLARLNFSYDSLFHVLRTGLTPISESDIDYIENYILTFKRTSFNSFAQEWKRPLDRIELDQVNEIRKNIYETFKPYMSVMRNSNSTVSDYCKSVYELLDSFEIDKSVDEYVQRFHDEGNYALEEEYSQIYSAIVRLLETIENTMGDEKITLNDFEKLIVSAIESLRIGVTPPGIDDVMVGDIERTRLKDTKKIIFLLGANDGVIPNTSNPATIVNDADRERLKENGYEFAPTTKDNVFKQMFYLYMLLTKPTEKFVVSFSNQDKDFKPLKQSYFVDMVKVILNKTKTIMDSETESKVEDIVNANVALDFLAKKGRVIKYSQDENEKKLYSSLKNYMLQNEVEIDAVHLMNDGLRFEYKERGIETSLAKDLYKPEKDIKVTEAQRFVNCPYNHFLESGLNLQDREYYQFDRLQKGNIEHDILERFFKSVNENKIDLKNVEQEEIDQLLDTAAKDAFECERAGDFIKTDSSKNFLRKQLTSIAKESVNALIKHLQRGKFVVSYLEERIPGGKADRVDRCEDENDIYVKVIDYKTGSSVGFSFGELMCGKNMQVFVYLKDALQRELENNPGKNVIPAGAFYFRAKENYVAKSNGTEEMSGEQIEGQNITNAFKMAGLLNREAIKVFDEEGKPEETVSLPAKEPENEMFDTENYMKLLDYVDDKIDEIRQDIKLGYIKVEPYDRACEFCSYQGICRKEMGNVEYKKADNIKAKDAIEILNGEEDVADSMD